MPVGDDLKGCVKNNFPVFLGNHPAELDGYFEIAEVIFDTLLRCEDLFMFAERTQKTD